MATKKTPAQIRWAKRRDKVNKARRDKRAKARAIREAAWPTPNTRLKTIARKAHKAGEPAVIGVDGASGTTVHGRMLENGVIEVTDIVVDNPDTISAKKWAALARKKGGIEKVAAEIADLRTYSYGSGKASGESGVDARMRGMRSMLDDRIVSAFIARMQLMETQSSNGLPPALVVSGLEIIKVIDALVSAGYSANSRMRSDMMGREQAKAEALAQRAG